jgi:hypothetical protein
VCNRASCAMSAADLCGTGLLLVGAQLVCWPVYCCAVASCREEELRILRGEAAVDESRLGGRLTAGSSDSGGSSGSDDDDAGFVDDTRRQAAGAGAGMRGAAGAARGLQQRQSFKQQQQGGAGNKVRIGRRPGACA